MTLKTEFSYLAGAKIASILVENDLGGPHRGAALGPLKIHQLMKDHLGENTHKIALESTSLQDCEAAEQNFARNLFSIGKILGLLESVVETELLEDKFVVILSGDHSTASGTIAGIQRAFPAKRLGVIWFDAHADIHSPFTTPSGNVHGMPLAIACGIDNLSNSRNAIHETLAQQWNRLKPVKTLFPQDVVFVGTRDVEIEEQFIIDSNGCLNYTAQQVDETDPATIVDGILDRLSACDLLTISFDIDCLDPSVASGTGTPVENGLSLEKANAIVSGLFRSEKICAFELTEINPQLDNEEQDTLMVATRVLQNMLKAKSDANSGASSDARLVC